MVIGIADHRVPHGVVKIEVIGLVQHAELHALAPGDLPGIRFEASGEHAQQRGLAVAVTADDADAVAFIDADRDRIKDSTGREFKVKGFGPEKMCHLYRVMPQFLPVSRRGSSRSFIPRGRSCEDGPARSRELGFCSAEDPCARRRTPPWCNGSTPAFGAVQSRFES